MVGTWAYWLLAVQISSTYVESRFINYVWLFPLSMYELEQYQLGKIGLKAQCWFWNQDLDCLLHHGKRCGRWGDTHKSPTVSGGKDLAFYALMHQIAVQNTRLSWSLWVASLERVLSKDSVVTWAMKEKPGVGMGWLNLCSVLLFDFCASHGLSIVGYIQGIDCGGDCGGHRCLSWQQPKNQLVDTSGERRYQAEKGGLSGWSEAPLWQGNMWMTSWHNLWEHAAVQSTALLGIYTNRITVWIVWVNAGYEVI